MERSLMLSIVSVAAMLVLLAPHAAHAGINLDVPEPGSLILLGTGAGAVAVGAWWRNRRK
jgi:hypothetical protein